MLNQILNYSMKSFATAALKKHQRYPADKTALILVDVQNEYFDSNANAKLRINTAAKQSGFNTNISKLVATFRENNAMTAFAPYFKNQPLAYPTPVQIELAKDINSTQSNWGDNLPSNIAPQKNDLVLEERMGLSIFSNTSLHKRLQIKGIEHLVFAGPLINITLDSSIRDAVELGYHSTLIKDSCAAFSLEEYRAAAEITMPRFCHAILSTSEISKKLAEKRISIS